MRPTRLLLVLGSLALALATTGCTGKDGTACSVTQNPDGSATIACDDGTSVTVPAPDNGHDGTSCTVNSNGDGTSTITCEDGTTTTITNGTDGASCTVVDNGDGTKTITCDDGTVVTVEDGNQGPPGGQVLITDRHGADFLATSGEFATGKYMADATITGATANAAGQVVVDFKVARDTGAPVVNAGPFTANIVKLVPVPFTPPQGGNLSDRWVPYITRTETVAGAGYPNPPGTARTQAYRESNGTLVNHGNGTYTYTFATNISTAAVDGQPVAYERNRTHRVSIMMGGHTGATATATFDFVPDGSAAVSTRDIVRTATCKNCHGAEFKGHGGDRITVENCVTCHNPGSFDAQGGQTLDMKVMIHKIHMGGELPSVAGPDHDPWATADNGSYAIWGFGNAKVSWEKVGFPAQVNNCQKCHDGSGANSGAWKERPQRAVCGACHDDVNFDTGVGHPGGPQATDNNCNVCHPADVGLAPLSIVHDRSTTNTQAPLYDDRNLPEFTFDVTMSPPANGTDYRGTESPVVSVVIKRNGAPLADHRIVSGTAQGCKHVASPVLCDLDTDGAFANSGFFVTGPRAHAVPVLTTAARAQVYSSSAGPFDLSAAGASLVVKVDQGWAITLPDPWGTKVPGLITIPVSTGTWAGGAAAATVAELVTWLNANATFNQRAVAFVGVGSNLGKLGIKSRNRGQVYGIQLQPSAVTTTAFAADTTVHMTTGFTSSNQLTSTTDAKVTRLANHIEYALDPVTDLAPGTYVINLEVSQLGRVSATDYKTPSVKKILFNVKQATEEKQVAGNCNSCHQATSGTPGDFDGFILDPSRHNKVFDSTAVDQCHACHDYMPQLATDITGAGAWTGSRPISKRVHAVHFGSSLNYPLRTVDYANGDPTVGRNWDITFPQDVRNCESCHPDGTTSGTWASKAARLPCMGCHDGDAAMTHMKLNTDDPTPADPWSGDESEACQVCH